MSSANGRAVERLGIAGSGRIACGLATVAADHGQVVLWARSDGSAERAQNGFEKRGEPCAANVEVTCDLDRLREATVVVESIVEDPAAKAELYRRLDPVLPPDALLATTTSALSVEELAAASGRPDRFRRRPARRRESEPMPCAPRSARRRSRSPTSRASSSTGCCSPTSSTPCACTSAPASRRRRSTPA
jgi:hypothetical protein